MNTDPQTGAEKSKAELQKEREEIEAKEREAKEKEREAKEKALAEKLKKFKVDNKYDPYTLKASLDDCITEILTEQYKMQEDHRHDNRKIIMGFLITVIMIISHFYPLPFPDNYNLLIGCVISYAIISFIYNNYETKNVKDCFLLCKVPTNLNQVNNAEGQGEEKPQLTFSEIFSFDSKIELYSKFYEIKIFSYTDQRELFKTRLSVEEYYDVEGNISYQRVQDLTKNIFHKVLEKSKSNNSERPEEKKNK